VFLCRTSINLSKLKREFVQECFIKAAMVVCFVAVTSVFLEQCFLCKKKEEINFYIAFSNIVERMLRFKNGEQ
jgi:hypothetical protein